MRLWYEHRIVGRSGATGCGVPDVWGDEAVATQGEAGQEHGVGGGLLAADGASDRRPGGLGSDRDRAAGADGRPALAALGLVLTMIGAALTHLRRAEYGGIAVNAVLLIVAAFVAYGRFFVLPA